MKTVKQLLDSALNKNLFRAIIITIIFGYNFQVNAQVTSRIISSTGDGSGNTLDSPWGACVDSDGNLYITGGSTDNAFKITPSGTVTEIIDATGDGGGNTLDNPQGIAIDGNGNVYVTGAGSDNAFKITPAGVITEIIDATGDGSGNIVNFPIGIAVKADGTAYIACSSSDNAFEISTSNVVTEIIDATGDGSGNTLDNCRSVAVDSSGNIYVTGAGTDNAFKITSSSVISEIIDATGDGTNALDYATAIAADGSGNVYVAGASSDNAFKITSSLVISEIIDATGDGSGNALDNPRFIGVSSNGYVLVSGQNSDNLFKITPSGTISELIDATGDGTNTLDAGRGVAMLHDSAYVVGGTSDNAFAIKNVTLPVNLVEFTHTISEDAIQLSWTTSLEENNSHFILEISTDKENFTAIETIAGAGFSTDIVQYQYLDKKRDYNTLNYRLKQVDFDGKTEILGIQKIVRSVVREEFKTYPNPVVDGTIYIKLPSFAINDIPVNIEILDFFGKVVHSASFEQNLTNQSEFIIHNQKLKSGIYIVRFSQQNHVHSSLIVIE